MSSSPRVQADQVIEVGDARGPLRARISLRKSLTGAKPRGHIRGQPGTILDLQEFTNENRKPSRVGFIMRFRLRLTGGDAQHVLVRKDHLPKRRKRGCPFDRRQRKPILNDVRVSKSGLCAPSSVGFSYGAKQVAVEALVAAVMDDIFLDGLIGQTHEHPQPLFDASRGAEACERLLSASAAHEILDCASFPEPEAEPLDVDN